MRRAMELLTGWRSRVVLVVATVFAFTGMAMKDPVRPDLLQLRDAGSLSGHLVARERKIVRFFTLGGEVRLPRRRVAALDCSSEGESELYLGKGFLKRRVWDSAEKWLRAAEKFPAWKEAARKALEDVKNGRQREEEKRRQEKRKQLATLIFRGDYEEGLLAIAKWSNKEEDLWAGQRARIHLILARNAVDHLNYRRADYHLEQAREAGMSGPEWQRLRNEVDYYRRTGFSILPGKRPPKPPSLGLLHIVRQMASSLGSDVDDKLIRLVQQRALEAGIDPLLVCAVIQAESAWKSDAKSRKGAKGLMQLMPMTAREMGVSNPMDPSENVKGGADYLRGLLDLYGVSDPADPSEEENLKLALGAYNAGPARIAKYKGLPPFKETRTYVKRVTDLYRKMKTAASQGAPS